MANSCIHLTAPLSGFSRPINEVPDPVFAQKIVGDGIAIDPTSNILKSPCNATVISLHKAKHAISLRTSEGIEILLHIGLDTVYLNGEGLYPKVKVGDKVISGQELIEFDADLLAIKAKSLLTTIVIINHQRIAKQVPIYGQIDVAQSQILTLYLTNEAADSKAISDESTILISPELSEYITIVNRNGLHARPAAALAHLAKSFPETISLIANKQTADAKSMVAIMEMNLQQGDTIQFEVTACCAQSIIHTLNAAVTQGLGDDEIDNNDLAKPEFEKEHINNTSDEQGEHCLKGIAASHGIVAGRIFQLKRQHLKYDEETDNIDSEHNKFNQSLDDCKQELNSLIQLIEPNNQQQANIFKAHYELLEDPGLISQTQQLIHLGKSAAFSWHTVIDEHKKKLQALKNTFLASRVADLVDIRSRVLKKMLGIIDTAEQLPDNAIIIAQELTPSDTVKLDKNKVLGFCTTLGGASSHVAIIARAMGLPAITGINKAALSLKNNRLVILDGSHGILDLDVSEAKLQHIKERQLCEQNRRDEAQTGKHEPAITLDKAIIKVAANIGSIEEAVNAQNQGADGIGLLRSEFLYFDKLQEPTEAEQQSIYQSIAHSIDGKHLTIRTLDVGGDKPLAYLTPAEEDNPALGERGIRMGLNSPEILHKQLSAILQSAPASQIRILFPMVANLDEFIQAKQIVIEICQRLNCPLPMLGIMIEVPSSALLAAHFAQHVDFFSIGTNDLTQYTLAMDRGHPLLAPYIDGLHPAVLQLIALTVKGAKIYNKPVGVCGCLASDPYAIPILIGLGVVELSVAVPSLPLIKAQIRQLTLTQCEQLANKALEQSSASAVRALLVNNSEQMR